MEEEMGNSIQNPQPAQHQEQMNNSGNQLELNKKLDRKIRQNNNSSDKIEYDNDLNKNKEQAHLLDSKFERDQYSSDSLQKAFKKARLHFSDHSKGMNPAQTFKKVKAILLAGQNNLTPDMEKSVLELADFWDEYELQDIYNNTDVVDEQQLQYYQIWMLSARVMSKVKHLFYKIRWKKQLNHQAYNGIKAISQYLDENQLEFYPNKNLLSKQAARFSTGSYKMSQLAKEPSPTQKSQGYIQDIYAIAKEKNIEIISTFFEFLAKIGLIQLRDIKACFSNSFIESLDRISKRQQKEMFISNYSCQHFKALQDAFEKGDKDELGRLLQGQLPNYSFYKGQSKVRRKGMDIEGLHGKFGDYQFMERVHDYIQWMFPNHYGSAFNSTSKPLNYIESELFLQDSQVKLSLLYSIFMFFDFMGLRLDLRSRCLSIVSEVRLEDVILVNFHNHLRLMRILACLSVTGFRSLALDLIKFLDVHSQKGKLLERQRRQFEKSWKIYGNKQDYDTAKNMCFLEKKDFPNQDKFIHQFLQLVFPLQIEQKQIPSSQPQPHAEVNPNSPEAELKEVEDRAQEGQ